MVPCSPLGSTRRAAAPLRPRPSPAWLTSGKLANRREPSRARILRLESRSLELSAAIARVADPRAARERVRASKRNPRAPARAARASSPAAELAGYFRRQAVRSNARPRRARRRPRAARERVRARARAARARHDRARAREPFARAAVFDVAAARSNVSAARARRPAARPRPRPDRVTAARSVSPRAELAARSVWERIGADRAARRVPGRPSRAPRRRVVNYASLPERRRRAGRRAVSSASPRQSSLHPLASGILSRAAQRRAMYIPPPSPRRQHSFLACQPRSATWRSQLFIARDSRATKTGASLLV